MTLVSSTMYSSDAQLLKYITRDTFNEWADLDGDGLADPGVSDEWHNQAKEEIDLYVLARGYCENLLAGNGLIQQWGVILALYYGSQTRGNPPPEVWERRAEQIFERLEKVREGIMQIPGLPLCQDMRPSMSNVKIDRRFNQQKVRVQQGISTDAPTTLSQNQSLDVPSVYP